MLKDLQVTEIPGIGPKLTPVLSRDQYDQYCRVHNLMEAVAQIEATQAAHYQSFGQPWRKTVMKADRALLKHAHEVLSELTGNPRGFLPEQE